MGFLTLYNVAWFVELKRPTHLSHGQAYHKQNRTDLANYLTPDLHHSYYAFTKIYPFSQCLILLIFQKMSKTLGLGLVARFLKTMKH